MGVERVRRVGAEVDGEPDGHDEHDHGEEVVVDAPQRHVADDAQLDREDRAGDDEYARPVRDEEEGDDDHGAEGQRHRLCCLAWQYLRLEIFVGCFMRTDQCLKKNHDAANLMLSQASAYISHMKLENLRHLL